MFDLSSVQMIYPLR